MQYKSITSLFYYLVVPAIVNLRNKLVIVRFIT